MQYILNEDNYMKYEFIFNLFIINPEEKWRTLKSKIYMDLFYKFLQEIKENKEIKIKRIYVKYEVPENSLSDSLNNWDLLNFKMESWLHNQLNFKTNLSNIKMLILIYFIFK